MQTSITCFQIVLLLLLAACTGDTDDRAATDEVVTWTLEEDLRIDEEEDYFLGSVADVAVRSDGAVLVLDREEYHIKLISSEGKLLQTIGRQGEGPGEFQGPRQLLLARNDSLYVLDGARSLYVFAPTSYTPARTVQLSGGPEGRRAPHELMVHPENGFLISYALPPILGGESDPNVYRIGEDGKRMGPVDIPRQGEKRMHIEAKSTVMPMDAPFDRQSVTAVGPEGYIYHGITDSLAVTVSKLSGEALDHWTLRDEPRPLTEADVHAFAVDFADEAAVRFGESIRNATREAVHEALTEADLPNTQPAFYDLLVDDRRRVWIRRDPGHVETATWWVASADGELLAEVTLPGSVRLEAVRDEYVYGTITGQNALPSVIRYRIE